MTVTELLEQIAERGIELSADGNELVVRGKTQTLDPALLDELKKNRQAILDFVREKNKSQAVTDPPPLVRLSEEDFERIVQGVPGGAANVQDVYPLAPLQEGMLFHHLLAEVGDPYLLAIEYSFDSRTQLEEYLAAFRAVIARHDILRTAIVWESLPEPMQVVWRNAELLVEEVELDTAKGDVARQLFERFDPRHYRIALSQAPMLRVHVAEDREKGRWLMMLLRHHLTGDHTTAEVIKEEIDAHLLGHEDGLPAPRPFRNLVAQARLGLSRQEHEAYFEELLGDVDEPTTPFGLLDVRGNNSRIEEAWAQVDTELEQRLRKKARKLGVSTASVVHLAWALVLAKTSGRTDVVFGTVLFGRMQSGEGADRTMGPYMNTLPVRIQVGQKGVEASVRRTHMQLAELMRHEHASLAQAQRCSGVSAPTPLFSALLNYRHNKSAAQVPSSEKKRIRNGMRAIYGEERTNYPFTLAVTDCGEGLILGAQVERSIGPKRVCGYMLGALGSVVQALEQWPTRAVCTVDILGEEERRKLVYEWNDTQREYASVKCVQELVEEQVGKRPEAVAVVCEEETLSYGELNGRANQLAHHLRRLGVKPEDRVAICMERRMEMVVGLLGVLKAGGAYVPLDPGHPAERLRYMLKDSGAVAVLTWKEKKESYGEWGEELLRIDMGESGEWERGEESNPGRKDVGLEAEHVAYVIYTSGTTGAPKGVMVPHAALVNTLVATGRELQLTSRDRTALVSGQAFDISIWEQLILLTVGGTVEIWKREQILDVGSGNGALANLTVLHAVPALMREIAGAAREHGIGSGIRLALTGGDLVRGDLIAEMRQAFGSASVKTLYGPTETAILATRFNCESGMEDAKTVPIGKPIGNVRIYILDGNQEPVPVGVTGELYIAGAGVARGYLNRPELTAERFLKDRFAGEGKERMYRTGDLGKWLPDGNIEFVGRNDFQVKIRGFRIELGEIEGRLAEHERVKEVVVAAREEKSGGTQLVAYYTSEGGAIGAGELRKHAAGKLPEHMVPGAYVWLEKMPLTANGKLDRKRLPAPEADAFGVREYEEPKTETEKVLAEIWGEVLKQERVGRQDNFFELGGHSLLAVTLMERMRRKGMQVDVRAIFTRPTLADLAAAIDPKERRVEIPPNGIEEGCEAIRPEMLPLVELSQEQIEKIVGGVAGGAGNVKDIYPLAPLQEGILFHHLMEAAGDPYLLGVEYSFENRAGLDRYLAALQAVIDRHDILRTGVVWEGLAEPVQVVWRKAELAVEEVELDPAKGDVGRQLYERFNPRHYRIDVSQAPLMRAYVAYDAERKRWLLMKLLHHLAGDHSTLEVMLEEIEAHLLGRADRLAEAQPFRNLVGEARLGVSREEHEAYFGKLLGDVEEPTAPFGLLNVRGDGTGIEEARMRMDVELGARVREGARKLGVSAASIFHVAWAQVVGKMSGREDVVFGTVLFGRMQGGEGSDRAMGPFMNTLPVKIQVGEQGVEEAVRGTHAQLAELMRHEHASLALAQKCSGVPAPTPLFTGLLNYRYSRPASNNSSAERKQAWDGMSLIRVEARNSYPLTLSVDDQGESLRLTAWVPATVGAARVCEYTHRAVEALVEALEKDPGRGMRKMDVVGEEEKRRVVYEWNETKREYRLDQCVHELFEEQVNRRPEAVAVVYGEEVLSYEELNRRAKRLGACLRKRGVKRDDRVAICVEHGVGMVVGLLGVLKAGGAYVPLDVEYPVERLSYMVADSGAVALVTEAGKGQGKLMELLEGLGENIAIVDLKEGEGEQEARAGKDEPAGVMPEDLIYVIYTSGSTGRPKGVGISHKNVVNYASDMRERLKVDECVEGMRFATVSTFGADLGNTSIYTALTTGGSLQIVSKEAAMDREKLKLEIVRHQSDVLKIVPSHLTAMMEGGNNDWIGSLKYLVLGGELLKHELVEAIEAAGGGVQVMNHYGPTEATIGCVTHLVRKEGGERGGNVPIGKPIGNTQVYVLDAQGVPAPVGVAGELYIGGAGVARGYLNRPEQTAERFLKDPFVEGEARMYRTGDVVKWLRDGTLEFLGRKDDQVKIRGYRIELGEIEERLAEHEKVREAAVVAREETTGDKRLIAYYTSTDSALGVDELQRHLAAKLPEYMVPAVYVRVEKMPLTANGKLDRKALPSPETDAYALREYEAPETPTEAALAEIWCEILKLKRVGRRDNFFQLGGHSLSAVLLIERMRRKGMPIEVRAVFTTPTLADLAAAVSPQGAIIEVQSSRIPAGCDVILPEMLSLADLSREEIEVIVRKVPGKAANVKDIYPLAPLQEGILFHHLLEEAGDPYVLGVEYSFDSRSRLETYLQALRSVIERHDILRTAVVWEGLPEPMQVVWRKAALPVQEVELDPAKGDAARQLYERFHPRRYRLDVTQAPMLRVYVAEDKENGRWLAMLLRHHLTGDHTASDVMREEIEAHFLGHEDRLPVSLPFWKLVAQARLGLSRQEHEEYFRMLLRDVDEPTTPFGLVNTPGDGTGIEEARLSVDFELARRVREWARKLGVSAASLFHLAWAQVLGRLSGKDDVVFGTVLFGRMQGGEGSDRAMGPFLNTLPVRIRVGKNGVETAVRGVHLQLAELMKHEHASLALAQRCSGVPAPTPLFSALFNYRHIKGALSQSSEKRKIWEGIRPIYGEERTNYALTLSVNDLGEGFMLTTLVGAAIGSKRICEYMHRALKSLVEVLEKEPTRPICRIEILGEEERNKVLYEWNETRREYEGDKCIHELFEEQAGKSAEAIAVVCGDEALSYGELNRRANGLGHYLRERGVKPEDRVGICVERSVEMVVGLLGVLKAGGAYVPIEPSYPEDRIVYMVKESKAVAVLTEGGVREWQGNTGRDVVVIELRKAEQWRGHGESNLKRVHGEAVKQLAYVIYTSGSTGSPKGAMNEHRGVVNRLQWMQSAYRLDEKDTVLQKTPFSFDVSVWELFWPLIAGAKLVMSKPEGHKDPGYLSETIQRYEVTTIHFVPSMLQTWVEYGRVKQCEALKRVICSGERLPEALGRRVKDQIGWAELSNLYGPTEAAVDVTAWRSGEEIGKERSITIGGPIANTRIYILDGQGEPAPMGVTGELYIGGVQVGRGYLERRAQTAERFVADPFTVDGPGRMYRTGDLARWREDGNIEFVGRNDFQVKMRGYRIELGEIEARLMECEGVREAVVLVREDRAEEQGLVAYVVPDQNEARPIVQQIRMRISGELPKSSQYELPNGMIIGYQNKSETDFLYREIFEEKAYLKHGINLPERACVFDVGANIGLFTMFALQQRPDSEIYAFEPIPPVFETLRINAEIYGGSVRLFKCGLSNTSGSGRFAWYKHNSVLSGRYPDRREEQAVVTAFIRNQEEAKSLSAETLDEMIRQRLEQEQFECPLRTVSAVIAEEQIKRIDLLKIDVEKSEWDVLQGIEEKDWHKIVQLVVEIHDIDGRLTRIQELLKGHGYEVTVEKEESLGTSNLYSLYARNVVPAAHPASMDIPLPASAKRAAYWNASSFSEMLRRKLRERLPEYMVPAAYVLLEKMPLTANGKLDRKGLPEPEREAFGVREYEGPKTEAEKVLAEIWGEVLKQERVGRQDNFFELGGHSLLAVTLMERMRRKGMQVDVRAIFTTPTLADLAAAIDPKKRRVEIPPNGIEEGCEAIRPEMLPLVELSEEQIEKIVGGVAGGAGNVKDIYPLAPLQEGILFHHLMEAAGDPYLLGVEYSFENRAGLDRYLAALQAVIDRHDILRTGVVWEGLAEPVQVVWRKAELAVEEVELDPAKGDVGRQLYERFNPRHYRIDVRQAPLMRAYVAYDAEQKRWLLMKLLHHLAGDHSTLEVMQEEIEAHLLGQADRLAEARPFRNLVGEARLGVSREEHEAYFGRLLGDVEEPTAPFGLLNVRGDGTGIEEMRMRMDVELGARVREGARKLGVSAASIFHVAWAQVVGKMSGREDVVFGTVLFGRMQGGEGSDRAMGPFMNTLPVRIQVGEQGVEEAVRGTHAQLAELMRHEHASLALAQKCSGVPAPTPLFSALFNYRHIKGAVQGRSREKRKVWEGMRGIHGEERTNYPFGLAVEDFGERFGLTAQVEGSVGAKRVCQYMHRAVESLVEALEKEPARAICRIDVFGEEERRRLLYEWNETRREYASEKCVHELFEEQVRRTGEAVAVVYEEEALSYEELNRQANRLGHYLREMGVKPDDRVGICLKRSMEMVVAMMGVLKAGGAYVPLDPEYPEQRLRYMLSDSGAEVLLTKSDVEGLCEGTGKEIVRIDVGDSGRWGKQASSNPERGAVGLGPEHLAYVIYTSGSTGEPKGVMVEHRQLSNLLAWMQEACGISGVDAVLQKTQSSFDASVTELFLPLVTGAKLVMATPGLNKDPDGLWRAIALNEITVAQFVPALLQAMLNGEKRTDGATMKWVQCGGEALTVSLVKQVREQLPKVRLQNLYGPTETAVDVITWAIPVEGAERGTILLGEPIANARVYILDERLEPVPQRATGELYIGGVPVTRGYLNRPGLTAGRFIPDPFVKQGDGVARMYRTGDLGKWLDHGNIEFMGRNDFQVKIRGQRIELGEIESRLLEYEGVREAVVVSEQIAGDKQLVAYYTGAGEAKGVEELRRYLAAKLPDSMVPGIYVKLDRMPLTTTGKLDRKSLPASGAGAYRPRQYEAPKTKTEEVLAEIWREVLKLEKVGRLDNFFELGGHSLLAVTLVAEMRRMGMQVDVRAIFTALTLANLAAAIDPAEKAVDVPFNGIPEGCDAIRPEMLPLVQLNSEEIDRIVRRVPGGAANVKDIYPLAPLQEGILFHHLMPSVGDTYLVAGEYSFDTRRQLDRYLAAMRAVIDRHDILRTAILWEGLPEPVQVVWRKADLPIEEIDLGAAAGDLARQLYERFNPRHYRLDVRQAPMMRACVAEDVKNRRWLLMLLRHHLTGDHTTSDLMREEIEAHLLDHEDRLPAPRPFRNLVAQARLGVRREEHEEYFRRLLSDVEESTAPFDLLDVRGDGTGIEEAQMRVDTALAARVRERARKLGVSAASLFHVAWAQVLGRLSGRQDVVFGTILFGRMQGGEGADRTMGPCMNTLPVRIQVGQDGVEEVVQRTRMQLAELMRHEHASLAQAQRCSGVPAPAPLFSAFLNYRYVQGGQTRSPEKKRAWEGVRAIYAEERSNYSVALSVSDLGEGFVLAAQVTKSIGPKRICEYMHRALAGLLEALENEPDKAISAIDVLGKEERNKVLYEWNETRREYEGDKCIHELFEEQAGKSAEAIAVVCGDEALSYGELNRRANGLGHYLRERGVKPEDRVGICVERSVEMVVGLLGVLKAGGAYVPLDAGYPVERLEYMLADSGPVALLIQSHLAGLFEGIRKELAVIDVGQTARWAGQPQSNPDRAAAGLGPEHLAYVIYTSGSTGQPKGVMVEHRGVCNLAGEQARSFGIDGNSRILQFASFSFDASVWETVMALCRGAALYIVGGKQDLVGEGLSRTLEENKVTHVTLPPAVLASLPESAVVDSLETLILAGDVVENSLTKRWAGRRVINAYGPTEATVCASMYECGAEEEGAPPIGKPIGNMRIYILDGNREPVPVGVTGELYIAGAGVARGYLNRPELTAERFLKDRFAGQGKERMYRTGDLGKWLPDGNIEFVGRNDFQVKIRGFRIELGEIEGRLAEHERVKEVVVSAREERSGGTQLVAYYTSEGGTIGAGELRKHAAGKLPEHMVPGAYVWLEKMPLTANGKLDRKRLPAPEADAFGVREYEEPKTETEKVLAEIWGEVLKQERVGRQDNFFELGGHSLSAVRIIAHLQQALGVEVQIEDLFEAPVLSELATRIATLQLKQFDIEELRNLIPMIRSKPTTS